MKLLMDKLVTENYDYLLKLSDTITKRKSSTHPDIKFDLLHYCITEIYNKIETHNTFLTDRDSFRKYLNKYMNQHYHWQKSDIARRKNDNSLFTYRKECFDIKTQENNITDIIEQDSIDELEEQYIILQAEDVNDITKMYLKDLLSNDISIERGLMYSKILDSIKNLTLVEKELFDLYFMQKLTVLDIYNLLKENNNKIGYHLLRKMVKELRIKIIELIKNDN